MGALPICIEKPIRCGLVSGGMIHGAHGPCLDLKAAENY
jgi:hypothetical protein